MNEKHVQLNTSQFNPFQFMNFNTWWTRLGFLFHFKKVYE